MLFWSLTEVEMLINQRTAILSYPDGLFISLNFESLQTRVQIFVSLKGFLCLQINLWLLVKFWLENLASNSEQLLPTGSAGIQSGTSRPGLGWTWPRPWCRRWWTCHPGKRWRRTAEIMRKVWRNISFVNKTQAVYRTYEVLKSLVLIPLRIWKFGIAKVYSALNIKNS